MIEMHHFFKDSKKYSESYNFIRIYPANIVREFFSVQADDL